MKLEEYLNTLPKSILSGQDVQLSEQTFRDIFKFVGLGKNDVFYHLGCGNGVGLAIAKEEFNAKKYLKSTLHSETAQSRWISQTEFRRDFY